MARQDEGTLRDVLGVVADAFKRTRDFHVPEDIPQIIRHGLAARDDRQRARFDLTLAFIHLGIAHENTLSGVHVAFHERGDGVLKLRLREAAHLQDATFQLG